MSIASFATAFELAQSRPARHLTSATKSNGIIHTMPYWDERFAAMASNYPGIKTDQFHIDILSAHFVQHPDWFDVVVGSKPFRDILSDLGPAVTGTIGIAPRPTSTRSATTPPCSSRSTAPPPTSPQGHRQPIGQIWSGAMMLDHLGHAEAAAEIVGAIERVLAQGTSRTPDLGGEANTEELGQAVIDAL